MQELCAELRRKWREGIPLSSAMQLEIARCSEHELCVSAPLAPNINLHGTAFAGSLYALAALTGWGAVWLALKSRGIDASIVLAEAQIRYVRAVREALVCTCRFDPNAQARALERIAEAGRAVFTLETTITAAGEEAIRFEGKYSARRE